MSLLVVIAIAVVVFLYVRLNKQARQSWLAKLDLPGRWLSENTPASSGETEQGGGETTARLELLLGGRLDTGDFLLKDGEGEWRGKWRLVGHTLSLTGGGRSRQYDLHLFKPGNIGLEDAEGHRRLLYKAADNVVPLRSTSSS